MALVNEQTVNAELFKLDYRILALGIIEFVEFCFDIRAFFSSTRLCNISVLS